MPKLWIVCKRLILLQLFWLGLTAGAMAAGGAPIAAGPEVPKPLGYVNDYAQVLGSEAETRLNGICAALEASTGAEMVFLIMPSIAPYDDFTFGMAVFDAWKIGKKGKDNGLLIMLALQERRIRIISGYGLEGILPDGKLGRYRDEYLVPFLKQNRLAEGFANIGLVIARDIAKDAGVELKGAAAQSPRRVRRGLMSWVGLIMVFVIMGISLLSSFGRRGRRYYGSSVYPGGVFYRGGGGGFGGGFSGFGGGFSGGGGVGGSW